MVARIHTRALRKEALSRVSKGGLVCAYLIGPRKIGLDVGGRVDVRVYGALRRQRE